MKALLGVGGILSIQGVAEIPPVTSTVEVSKLVIQVIIAIATLFQMFKKPKPNSNK